MTAVYNSTVADILGRTGYPSEMIGNATSAAIGFYGTTPVTQQANTVSLLAQLINLGLCPSGTNVGSRGTPNLVTASTATIVPGAVNLVSKAAGFAIALPAATGTGNVYDFIIGTTVTTGSQTFVLNSTAGDKMYGNAFQTSGASTATFYASGATTAVTFNGSTLGGFIGDKVSFLDVSTGIWAVNVMSKVTGIAATPFS